jgi:hypothetical protein
MTVNLIQDIHAGKAAFERHLAMATSTRSLAERGWICHDDLTLLVPLRAINPKSFEVDSYLLRLTFDYYPDNPPGAMFVNPETLVFAGPDDAPHMPLCESSPQVHFHLNYPEYGPMICASTTLEFYKVNHGVNEQHRWDGKQRTFLDTIASVKSGLNEPFYRGRQVKP